MSLPPSASSSALGSSSSETPITQVAQSVFAGYAPPSGGWDELLDPKGGLRPAWLPLINALAPLGNGLGRRVELARKLMKDGGVSFRSLSPTGKGTVDRPWDLDAIPHVISAADWAYLESGLIQRARLLEQLLADLYGPQKLLRNGLLPVSLLYGQQNFLRSVHGLRPQQTWLHHIAFEVARTSTGQWIVLGDRTQTPTGFGYALENRNTTIRAFSEAYQACHVLRLLPFFDQFRNSLQALSPAERESPRVVLWTEGANQTTYFEQLMMARQLGIPLVEDADLTARNNMIYVKTLGGLRPVRVILRCTEDYYADPLEIASNQMRGVPGLVQAVRAGNVALANALGSGLVGNASLMPFLPAVAPYLLGEELQLPSVPTRWCGDASTVRTVQAGGPGMILKRVGGPGPVECIEHDNLSEGERTALLEKMRYTPEHYVLQYHQQLSTTPVRTAEGRFVAQPVVVRVFALWTPEGWRIMPGGLALTSPAWESNFISLASATATKDTWVLSEEPITGPVKLRPLFPPVEITRINLDLPSRVADNMFWLGRYVERAESQVRVLRVLLERLSDETHISEDAELDVLLRWMASENLVSGTLIEARRLNREPELEKALLEFMFGTGVAGMRTLWENLRRTLWLVRDRMSVDAWRFLTRVEKFLPLSPDSNTVPGAAGAMELLNEILLPLLAFSGLSRESMTRGPGWRFLDMGRRIERAYNTAGLLRQGLVRPEEREEPVLRLLLQVGDSSMTYSARYQVGMQAHAVLDLLLTDETNPRSVAHQLQTLSDHVEELTRGQSLAQRTPEQNQLLSLNTVVMLAQVSPLVNSRLEGKRRDLDQLLDKLLKELPTLSNILTNRYFSHAEAARSREQVSS